MSEQLPILARLYLDGGANAPAVTVHDVMQAVRLLMKRVETLSEEVRAMKEGREETSEAYDQDRDNQ